MGNTAFGRRPIGQSQHQARSLRDFDRGAYQDHVRCRRGPWWSGTAYVYDWNMLPIGQTLWLKELQTYIDFPRCKIRRATI